MANDNIFQQYLTPPKSVLEYSADLDAANQRKQVLKQNALSLAAGQQKYDEGVQSSQRAAQLRAALSGLGPAATDDDRIKAMRGTGSPEGFAAADGLEKSVLERGKTKAGIDKENAEVSKTNLARNIMLHDFHAQKLAQVQTPEQAIAWAKDGLAAGLGTPEQYERGVAMIQQAAQSPEAFAKWRAQAMQGGQSITEQLKAQAEALKQQEQIRQFNATDARIKSEGSANRAQSDRHFNTTQENGRTQVVQSDNGPVLVNMRTGAGRVLTGADGAPLPGVTKPLNDSQSKALLFGTRMQEADKVLAQLANDGTTTSIPGSRAPVIGGIINALSSGNRQSLDQAKRDFMTAALRRESGASISPGEFDTADKQYFPQPGDSDQVKAQKARNRQLAIHGVLVEVPEKQRGSITPPSVAPAVAPKGAKPSLDQIFGN